MNFPPAALRFIGLMGIREQQSVRTPARLAIAKPKIKLPQKQTFANLIGIGSSTDSIAAAPAARMRRDAFYQHPAAASTNMPTSNAPRVMTTTETAAAILAAGEKARNGTSPKYAHGRIVDLMNRARHDHTSGVAAKILAAAAKARNETIFI